MKERIIIGSRKSRLALLQAQEVIDALRAVYPRLSFEITTVKTAGDRDRKTSLKVLGGRGIFVKELEEALLRREIDIAVHSLKDMPTDVPAGLKLAAMTRRLDPRDVLISAGGAALAQLPAGARIGTGSQRRTVQLISCRPDVAVVDIRGNIDTRLRKYSNGEFDALILAAAAAVRMKIEDRVTEYLPTENFIPAAGQGALGIEIRDGDEMAGELVAPLNHEETWSEASAERAFLGALGGGCREPIAALGVIIGSSFYLRGMVANSATCEILKADVRGRPAEAEQLGVRLARKMARMGAGRLIGRDFK